MQRNLQIGKISYDEFSVWSGLVGQVYSMAHTQER